MTEFYTNVISHKGKLLVQKYKDGKRVKEVIPYRPYLFMSHQDGDYKTVYGDPVKKIEFDSIWNAREFTEKYKNVQGMNIHGFSTWEYQYIYHNFEPNAYDGSLIRVGAIDIETDSSEGEFGDAATALKEVTAISLGLNGTMHTFGMKDFDATAFPNTIYYKCKSEEQLLMKFLTVWQMLALDAISGWNIRGYDIPYLINRITRILGEEWAKKLSPWGLLTSREVMTSFGVQKQWTIVGVADFDYKELYTKFQIPLKGRPESMSLNYICTQELGVKKLDYSEYGNLDELYKQNPQKFFEYNIRDTALIFDLDKKLNLIAIAIAFAYRAGINFSDIYGTVRPWDVMIHRYLMDRKIVAPFDKITQKDFKIEGGHVKDPQNGLHRWPVSYDLASLYPHIVMQNNIGPETFVRKVNGIHSDKIMSGEIVPRTLLQDNETLAANGSIYRTDVKSFLAAIMEMLFAERQDFKRQMLVAKQKAIDATTPEEKLRWQFEQSKNDNLQHVIKILANGGYGALTNFYNRWCDPDNGEAITQAGQLSIKWAERAVNTKLNELMKTTGVDYVIAIDTDSLYITLEKYIDKLYPDQTDKRSIIHKIDDFCKSVLSPLINDAYEELAAYVNAKENRMSMKREALADVGIWTGKKHYILNVYNNEGVEYDTPQMKIVGIEAVRSSTPGAARERIKTAIDKIVAGSQSVLQDYVQQVREEFNTLPIDEIAFPRGVSDIEKWSSPSQLYEKGCPAQVKACIFHNALLKKLEVRAFPPIKSGEKIKFVYVVKNNPYGIPIIGFASILPPQFGLEPYVDRRKQFEKGFLAPVQSITDAIGWNAEPTATLDKWFV